MPDDAKSGAAVIIQGGAQSHKQLLVTAGAGRTTVDLQEVPRSTTDAWNRGRRHRRSTRVRHAVLPALPHEWQG